MPFTAGALSGAVLLPRSTHAVSHVPIRRKRHFSMPKFQSMWTDSVVCQVQLTEASLLKVLVVHRHHPNLARHLQALEQLLILPIHLGRSREKMMKNTKPSRTDCRFSSIRCSGSLPRVSFCCACPVSHNASLSNQKAEGCISRLAPKHLPIFRVYIIVCHS